MGRAIIHVDMDAFYASVEQRDNPDLRGRPVIVGGHPRRGVVLAASYEVRPFGVHSAMPVALAVRMAPHAVLVAPRFRAYAAASDQVFDIFGSVTPLVEPLSLDEAFLDVTGSQALLGTPWDIATMLRERIAKEVGLPASAGIAAVKFVAKLASDLAKPNGQIEVAGAETVAFLARLPIGKLWGVGPKTERHLRALGLATIGDVAARDPRWLEERFGVGGRHLWELAHGIDERTVVPERAAKSIGAEDTFEDDLMDLHSLRSHVHSQALRVGRRLRRAGVRARVVRLKVKFADFKVITRCQTLAEPTDDGQTVYRVAESLLGPAAAGRKVRLTGVSALGLVGHGDQAVLFAEPRPRADKLNEALDRIAARYGPTAVTTADLVGDGAEDDARRATGASSLDALAAQRARGTTEPSRRRGR